jgi:hypothetical protein
VVASSYLRGYKNDVGSNIWVSHVHERFEGKARPNVPLKNVGHSVNSIRKLAAVSAALPEVD